MIYAISDVHGDIKQATKLLHEHNIIDDEHNWSAGSSILVVNGDSTDRGPDGIHTLQFFYNLTQQAHAKGGRVIHTMGNHDALILSIALQNMEKESNFEQMYVFQFNGGNPYEAKHLSIVQKLRQYVQSFPLMCRIDDVLFQHADGFATYQRAAEMGKTPDERIHAANMYARDKTTTAQGAWELFYGLTTERRWHNQEENIPGYLDEFGASVLVHGHTGFLGDEPMFYLNNQVVNIDATMSIGYRKDENRGCVLVLNKPGKNIVVHG